MLVILDKVHGKFNNALMQPAGFQHNKMVLTFSAVPHSSKTIGITGCNEMIDWSALATLCQHRAREQWAVFSDR